MNELSLLIDGMLSGTGIRDAVNGGYLEPKEVGLSDSLCNRLSIWLEKYADAHFHQYDDPSNNEILDQDGIEIARMVRAELPNIRVGYFSNVKMRQFDF